MEVQSPKVVSKTSIMDSKLKNRIQVIPKVSIRDSELENTAGSKTVHVIQMDNILLNCVEINTAVSANADSTSTEILNISVGDPVDDVGTGDTPQGDPDILIPSQIEDAPKVDTFHGPIVNAALTEVDESRKITLHLRRSKRIKEKVKKRLRRSKRIKEKVKKRPEEEMRKRKISCKLLGSPLKKKSRKDGKDDDITVAVDPQ